MRFLNDKDKFETAKCANGPNCVSPIRYRVFEDIQMKYENNKDDAKKYIRTIDLKDMCKTLGLNNCKDCEKSSLEKIFDDDIIRFAFIIIIAIILYKKLFNT